MNMWWSGRGEVTRREREREKEGRRNELPVLAFGAPSEFPEYNTDMFA